MDESVLRSMRRFPNVPDVYGWLSLDIHCRWFLRGVRVTHPLSIDFFNRCFSRDRRGCWYVQNGPQRVFVDLAYLPLLFSHDETGILRDQRGKPAEPIRAVLLDGDGHLILDGAAGPGLVADQCLFALSERVRDERGEPAGSDQIEDPECDLYLHTAARRLPLKRIDAARVARYLGLVRNPSP